MARLGLERRRTGPLRPGEALYFHGTAARFADAIVSEGLLPRPPQSGVHVTDDIDKATVHAWAVVAREMMASGDPNVGALIAFALERPLLAVTFHPGPILPDRIVAVERFEIEELLDEAELRNFALLKCRDRAYSDSWPCLGARGWEGPHGETPGPALFQEADKVAEREFGRIEQAYAARVNR